MDTNNGMIDIQIDSGSRGPQNPLTQNGRQSSAYIMTTSPIASSSTSSSVSPSLASPSSATAAAASTPSGHSAVGHRPRSGSAREQAVHAVEYYNSNVLRARVGAGLSGPRSSVNERHHLLSNGRTAAIANGLIPPATTATVSTTSRVYLTPEHLYRSNSSLELLHDQSERNQNDAAAANSSSGNSGGAGGSNLRREYGSHGSIDVISNSHGGGNVIGSGNGAATTSESFFAMLQDYRPAVLGVIGTDQRSPGPAEFLKGKVLHNTNGINSSGGGGGGGSGTRDSSLHQSTNDDSNNLDRPSSPKLRNKLQKLWGPHSSGSTGNNNNSNNSNNHNSSSNKQVGKQNTVAFDDCTFLNTSSISMTSSMSSINYNQSSLTTQSASTTSADIEERQRRRAFAHYDCQSLTANLGYAAKLRGLLLARRRNTTTGASAASMMTARSATPDADSGDEDYGDGQCNDLLENCPFFRNEIGSEEEREVSLTRIHTFSSNRSGHQKRAIHRPALACGVSILECPPNETLWKQTTCPFQRGPRPIESVDHGARYYRQYFHGDEHQNWFGMEEQLGPIAISIKREKLPPESLSTESSSSHQSAGRYQFRLIIRTSELLTLRGSVLEESVPNPRGSGKQVTTKEVLEYVAPEVQLNCLRLGVNSPQCEQQLIKLDEQGLTNKYKVGILYCRSGQSSEEDMYNNEETGPAFMEFLETIGKRVRLKSFEHYKAGLDNKTDSTGTHSVYATYQDCEIMFHVSTMLPFTPNNHQQLLRKRHIGNDIVTIVFQEPGALPFTPKNIRSQFQHVFIIVRAINPCTENTSYRVAVSRSKEVPVFGPPIPAGALFPRGKQFSDFLLAKVINAENAAHRSEKFATMATRTRQEYLKDLATNYCTATLVDPGTKFSIFPSKKKEKPKPRFSGDCSQRGAFCWQVVLQDSGLAAAVDCFLGISAETFVLIEECSRQIVFVTPTKAILGWSTSGNSLRIYHHQGECVTINMRDYGERDEQLEVIERLRSVTLGCGALELSLRRNPMGQLGFHVQPDGVVTQVETSGQAWVAGLRQGYRLVEICKVAVATLSHDQMVDLLKTSAQVTVTVIESFADHTPRRGCFLQHCKFNAINYENEYETSESAKGTNKKLSNSAQLQKPVTNHRRRYERNFSPPRSSNSSGYGTGSSSRSFSIPNEHIRQVTDMGTLTSSSSGHSSNDDRWYDILENIEHQGPPHSAMGTVMHHGNQQSHHSGSSGSGHNVTNNEHPKLMASSSLPMTNSSNPRPLSIHDPTKITSSSLGDHHRPSPRMANVEYLITKTSSQSAIAQNHNTTAAEAEQLLKSLTILSDGNGTDSSSINNEPIYNKSIHSTDEESLVDASPRLRRSATTSNVQKLKGSAGGGSSGGTVSSSSASSSRNNSPRPHSEAIPASVAAKLRPGVTNRNQAHLLQRNSVNYTTSSLQEDLMKLINPDYLVSSDDSLINGNAMRNQKNISNSHSLGNISALSGNFKVMTINDELLLKKKSRSREAINLGQQPVPELKKNDSGNNCDNEKAEVIFTTARPAAVISQAVNQQEHLKALEENVLHISEGGNTPNFRKGSSSNARKKYEHHVSSLPLPLLPDTNDMDWSTLVDTATRAMMLQFQEEQRRNSALESNQSMQNSSSDSNHQQYQSSQSPTIISSQNSINNGNSGGGGSGNNSGALPELQSHLTQLEDRILRETRRRKSLEHAVRRLTEENRRLQDESQAAVQQLRRFTEWFFQTIDRQS